MAIYKDARADIIQEFLEVSFHTILYIREIYPHALFQPRRKYNIPVKMCCHPELNQYIKDILQTIHSLLLQDAIEKVDLLLISPNKIPLDCYSFLVQKFNLTQQSETDETNFVELEDSFRAGLLKINISDTITQTILPPNTSFLIHLHTNKQAAASLYHDQEVQRFPWIEVDSTTCVTPKSDSCVVPLKTIDVGWLKISIQMTKASGITP